MTLVPEDPSESHESLALAHGILCALAVAVIFPLGAIFLRFSTRYPVSIHKWTQVLGSATYLAGFVTAALLWAHVAHEPGWSLGRHGALGLAVSICLFLQAVLGLWNHRRYRMQYLRAPERQVAAPPRMMVTAWLHVLLGWFIVLGGIVNGGLGINKSAREDEGSSTWTIPYSAVAGIMGAGFGLVMGWSWLRRLRKGWPETGGRRGEDSTELPDERERMQFREARAPVNLG